MTDTLILSPCTHEEADTGLLLHSTDATKYELRTLDNVADCHTDVVAIATFHHSVVPEL